MSAKNGFGKTLFIATPIALLFALLAGLGMSGIPLAPADAPYETLPQVSERFQSCSMWDRYPFVPLPPLRCPDDEAIARDLTAIGTNPS